MISYMSNPPPPLDTHFSLQSFTSQTSCSAKSNISTLCFIFALQELKCRKFYLNVRKKNYCARSQKKGTGGLERLWILHNGDIQNPKGHSPEQLAVADPALRSRVGLVLNYTTSRGAFQPQLGCDSMTLKRKGIKKMGHVPEV